MNSLLTLAVLAGMAVAGPAPAECPDRVVYGDPSHPSQIIFLTEGRERVLHFERVAVVVGPEGVHTVHIPPFGPPEGQGFPMEIRLTASPALAGYTVRLDHSGAVQSDCMRIFPDLRWERLESGMEVLEAPGDGARRFSAEIRLLSGGDAPSGLVARIETDDVVVLPASGRAATGTLRVNARGGAADTVAVVGGTAVLHQGTGMLELEVAAEGRRLSRLTIGGVAGGPQVVAVPARRPAADGTRAVTLYEIHELSPDGLVYDQYFKRASEANGPADAERSYDLQQAEWNARVKIPAVAILPPQAPLVIEPAVQ